jgi:hypothetical protein
VGEAANAPLPTLRARAFASHSRGGEDMTPSHKQPGRLRGGLSRIGWAVAEALIGGAIGVLFAALWLANR